MMIAARQSASKLSQKGQIHLIRGKTMSFANLKKQSKMGSLTEKLIKQVEKLNDGGGGSDDERFWKPSMDKSGTGYAVIRFMPAGGDWDDEYVQVFNHAFQGPSGQWLIDNCPTTLSRKCPVCDHNREDWNTGSKEKQNIVRDRKRKLSYYSNVYIIKDPANPENEGKVKIFKYGKKIFEKIDAALRPKFQDEEAINPFDFWSGADFKLKICKVDGYWNYDKSEFSTPSEFLDGDDDELKKVYDTLYNLNDFVDPEKFKSYDDLKNRLDLVLGLKSSNNRKQIDPEVEDEVEDEYEKLMEKKSSPTKSSKPTVIEDDEDEDEDNALDYFSKLAEM